jgi:hypothetical protein
MRMRATVAALSGALVLSALAVPAAQADGASYEDAAAEALASSGRTSYAATAASGLDVKFSKVKVAKAVKVGTTNRVRTKITYKLTHGPGVDIRSADFDSGPFLYKGSLANLTNILFSADPAKCAATSATTADCSAVIDIHPALGDLDNAHAGTWKVGVMAFDYANDTDVVKGNLASTLIQRNSKLTVNASPEPVKKGKKITVTGKLTRANWQSNKYAGYTKQPVKLQFRKKNSSTYTTLKTVKTDSKGKLKTTVKATVDGYYRFSFGGTKTTPAVKAAGDFVDVR